MTRLFSAVLVCFCLFTSGAAAPAQDKNNQEIVHLLNRIGYGPRPGDVERVAQIGIKKYIEQQLNPVQLNDASTDERASTLATLQMSSGELLQAYPRGSSRPQPLLQELIANKLIRAVHSERQLQEVLTDFWFNHFNVFWGKGPVRWLTTEYEMDVIRPRALGKFKDLLSATAKSPAMLVYLDNFQSVSPDPRIMARRQQARRKPGINENYAREIMELHTLGVDGGYTQQDVQEVARAFTGWSIEQPSGTFMFRRFMHDQGEKKVLGKTIRAGGGIEDGEQVIDILAGHPSTARFIATKLVARFVSDTPPQNLVDRVASTYLKTDGDIREMMLVILGSDEFWSADALQSKTKSPLELAASAIRALGGTTTGAIPLAQAIARMGQPLYQYQAPTGYPDAAEHWINNGALIERVNFSVALTANKIRGTAVQLSGFDDASAAAKFVGSAEFQKR